MDRVGNFYFEIIKEEFEDTKGATRNRISKRSRQPNGQKKKYKRTNNDRPLMEPVADMFIKY
jgi:hypothetical protein